ncbi:DUF2911 domain-containing protein [Spongiimicrobium sp. 3-5]|uniref:DUF2911 domain-containing protein n=1 Tax=Spongiimicrobium sp. 3-5 TaxID=3332596 RepID=UPI00397FF09D
MKKVFLLLCVVLVSFAGNAQVNTPQPSPSATLMQTVGLTDVTLEYSRPSMRGRTIFGDLVPYNEVWRTGANARTKITFSDDVTVDGQTLKAGTYAIFTKPGETAWEVIFYTDAQGGGTPREWDDAKVAAKAMAQVNPMPMAIETFTMTFDDLSNNSANLGMLWEKSYVAVKFEVPTMEKTVKSIETVMNGPSANDYYSAASYYYAENKDLEKAKEWIDKAVAMDKEGKAFWVMRRQSLIHAKVGATKTAIEAAKKSLASAEAAGNEDYVKMNKESLKEWGAL